MKQDSARIRLSSKPIIVEQTSHQSESCIESYLNSPSETPEDELQTEILIPIEKGSIHESDYL